VVFIRKADAAIARCEKVLIVVLFWGLIGLIVFNIFARNIFQTSFSKAFELAPTFVLWLALLGASLALRQGRHIRLELFLRYCPPGMRFIANVIVDLFGIIIMGILCYTAFIFVVNEMVLFGGWGAAAVIFPVFFFMAAFRLTTHLILLLWDDAHYGGVK
jgi:TRAP-type C4-dicarboxylate transport system permease small subunit